jgi:Helix-turn-helix domain
VAEPARLDAVFGALADPTRRAILARLARGEASVTELAAPFDFSLPAVTKLVAGRKEGRVRRCRLRPRPLRDADRWLRRYEQFWTTRLDSLAAYVEGER